MSSTVGRAGVAAVVLATSGCSLLTDENDFTRQPARAIAEQAFAAMGEVSSVRVLGTASTDDGLVRMDVRVDADSCVGSMVGDDGEVRVLKNEQGRWIRPEDRYWRAQAPTPGQADALLDRFGGRWIAVDRAKDLPQLCSFDALMEGFQVDEDDTEATLDKGEIVEVGDTMAIAVTGTEDGERVTAWVAVDAPHRVLKLAPEGATVTREAIFFEEFDAEVVADTPARKDVVRVP